MVHEFKTERMVEFAETDMAGLLHFSNYFRYMEAAEHAFFRSLGLTVHTGSEEGAYGAARRAVSCTFERPLRYQDVVELQVLVKEKRRRSITYVVVFRKKGKDGGVEPQPAARGEMTVVFVARSGEGDGLVAVPIPSEADSRLEVAPASLLEG